MGYDAKPGTIDVYFLPPIDTSAWRLADLERNRDASAICSCACTTRCGRPASCPIRSRSKRSSRSGRGGTRMSAEARTLVDVLASRARATANDVAYTFLVDGEPRARGSPTPSSTLGRARSRRRFAPTALQPGRSRAAALSARTRLHRRVLRLSVCRRRRRAVVSAAAGASSRARCRGSSSIVGRRRRRARCCRRRDRRRRR